MTYQFARINLEKTTYKPAVDWFLLHLQTLWQCDALV